MVTLVSRACRKADTDIIPSLSSAHRRLYEGSPPQKQSVEYEGKTGQASVNGATKIDPHTTVRGEHSGVTQPTTCLKDLAVIAVMVHDAQFPLIAMKGTFNVGRHIAERICPKRVKPKSGSWTPQN
jgi:hypothetical protein